MPIAQGPSSRTPPGLTTPNPWAQSLADLLRPWTDALNDLSTVASKNFQLCDAVDAPPQHVGSLARFADHCRHLVGVGNDIVDFQGLGAQAFANIYNLNIEQSTLINGKIQDFSNATLDLRQQIQSLNARYELSQDGGIYWNAGPDQDPWSPSLGEFLANHKHDNNYVLSTLMEGFLTTTAIDDLLKPWSVDATIITGIQIGMNQISKEMSSSQQAQIQADKNPDGSHPSWLDTDFAEAVRMLNGFANNMITQLGMWAEELYALADTYVQQVNDAGDIKTLTQLPKSTPQPFNHDPTDGASFKPLRYGDPTHDTYFHRIGMEQGVNTLVAKGSGGAFVLRDKLSDIQGKLNDEHSGDSNGLLVNLLEGVASAAGIVASCIPLLGEVEDIAVAGNIAYALLNGAATGTNIASGSQTSVTTSIAGESQTATTSFDAIQQLKVALDTLGSQLEDMPLAVAQKWGFKLTEEDTYRDIIAPGTTMTETDYSSITGAKFNLSYFTISNTE